MDKEQRRRKWETKRLNEIGGERRFRTKLQTPKPVKEKKKRLTKKDILNFAFNPDLPSDVEGS
jgi:hypothetical protein